LLKVISSNSCAIIICRDDTVMKTAIGVLGDLADTLGVNSGPLINQSSSSKQFLEECLASDDPLVKESADWARIAISRMVSG
jgi:importin subunit beta-1